MHTVFCVIKDHWETLHLDRVRQPGFAPRGRTAKSWPSKWSVNSSAWIKRPNGSGIA